MIVTEAGHDMAVANGITLGWQLEREAVRARGEGRVRYADQLAFASERVRKCRDERELQAAVEWLEQIAIYAYHDDTKAGAFRAAEVVGAAVGREPNR